MEPKRGSRTRRGEPTKERGEGGREGEEDAKNMSQTRTREIRIVKEEVVPSTANIMMKKAILSNITTQLQTIIHACLFKNTNIWQNIPLSRSLQICTGVGSDAKTRPGMKRSKQKFVAHTLRFLPTHTLDLTNSMRTGQAISYWWSFLNDY